jgi:hypothetical protein
VPNTTSHSGRTWRIAAVVAVTAVVTTGAAQAQADETPPGWLVKARGLGPDQLPPAAVPKCAYKPAVPLPRNTDNERKFRRWLERGPLCNVRIGLTIASLYVQFLGAVDEGDGQRACRLLTRRERARLGGSLCAAQFEAIAGRLRVEREPFPFGFKFERHFLRGELSFRLVRPLESIRMRFEAERGRWRIANARDLFRQRLPVPPPARG